MKTATTFLSMIFVALLAASANGQNDFIWSGENGSSWANGENWINGQPPTGGENADVIFANTANSATAIQDINDPLSLGNLSIDSSNGEFDIQGDGIVIDGGQLSIAGSQTTKMSNNLGFASGGAIVLEHSSSSANFDFFGSTIAGNQSQAGGVVEVLGNGRIRFFSLTSLPAHLQIGSGVQSVFDTGSNEVNIANGFDSDGDVSLIFTNLNFEIGATINGNLNVNSDATIAAPRSTSVNVNGQTTVFSESSFNIADETTLDGQGGYVQQGFSFASLGNNSIINKNAFLGEFAQLSGSSSTSTVAGQVVSSGGVLSGQLALNSGLEVTGGLDTRIGSGAIVDINGQTVISSGRMVVNESAVVSGKGNVLALEGTSIDMQFGTIAKEVTVEDGAWLTGNGEIAGNVDMMGMIAPGNSAGTITVDGDIDMADTTITCIELGGDGKGEFDLIRDGSSRGTNNTAFLDGELVVTLIDGYEPDASHDLVFIQGFNIVGQFDNTGGNGPGAFGNFGSLDIGSGTFQIEYGSNFVRLFGFQAVPEPGAAMVLVCCSLVLVSRRRR